MPFNGKREVPAGEWLRLTEGAVTEATFQNVGGGHVFIAATVGTTAPADPPVPGAWPSYPAGYGQLKVSLAGAFPGVSGASHLWAWSERGATLWVSHA
jgi:hypothetical protein